jgi:hypothetical protein
MAKYIKKPVVVDAIEWTGDNQKELEEFGVKLKSPETILNGGEFIVREGNGSLTIYSRSAFFEVYQRHLEWDENI